MADPTSPVTNESIVSAIIAREGGYSNVPGDKGGATKFGITQQTLSDWRKTSILPEDVKQLGIEEARKIYIARYISGPGYDKIEDGRLRSLVVDSAVQHGPRAANVMLQRALHLPEDGIFGPVTREAVKNASPTTTWMQMFGCRLSFYGRLVTSDPSQAKFCLGWMNRMKEQIEQFVL